MKKIIIITMVIFLGFAASAHAVDLLTKKDVSKYIEMTYDQFKKTKCYYGPRIFGDSGIPFYWLSQRPTIGINARLRYIEKVSEYSFYQIYITYCQDDWCFFQSAYDRNGRELKFIQIDRAVQRPGVCETFAVSITREYLEIHKNSGISLKVYSNKGCEEMVRVPSHYIQAFLEKIDK